MEQTLIEATHFVKCREVGKKQWSFLTRNGINRLRIHALRFTEESAKALIAENAGDNPEWEFKLQPIDV